MRIMVRMYKRKLGARMYKNYLEDTMLAAIEEVNKGTSIGDVAKSFGLVKSTLSRRYKGETTRFHGHPTALSVEEEEIFVSNLTNIDRLQLDSGQIQIT